ncbi:MAG: hypothetical protein EB168_08595 [Euryarchaeota archaeon]|nr:hypothetical protein [Euryarchaeota archaeon]
MSESNLLGGDNPVDQAAEILMGGPLEEQEVSDETVFESEESEVEFSESEDDGHASDDVEPEEEFDQTDDGDGLVALAQELGLDGDKLTLSEDGEIMVKIKVNGKEQAVDLKEAISQTQYSKANEEKARTIAEERKAFESERQQVADAYTQQLQHIQGLGEMLQGKLMQEYQSIDWDRLRVTDPAEWTAKQREFELRNQELQQAGMALGQRMREAQQQQEQWESQERAKILQAERKLMVESNPEWADENKLKSDLTEIIDYAKSNGFPEDELSQVIHSRHVNVLRKAMLFDKGQTVAEKKVKQAPKMQRASNGRFVSQKKSKTSKLIERAKNAKGANKRNAQHDAVAAILMGE